MRCWWSSASASAAEMPGCPVISRSCGVMWPETASAPSPARTSRVVRMPTRRSSSSTTRSPETPRRSASARAWASVAPGAIVCGSEMTRVRKRFTRATSATSSSTERKRCSTPMPPSCASAIAIGAVVTVSMLAETTGISSAIRRVR